MWQAASLTQTGTACWDWCWIRETNYRYGGAPTGSFKRDWPCWIKLYGLLQSHYCAAGATFPRLPRIVLGRRCALYNVTERHPDQLLSWQGSPEDRTFQHGGGPPFFRVPDFVLKCEPYLQMEKVPNAKIANCVRISGQSRTFTEITCMFLWPAMHLMKYFQNY